MKKDLSVAIIGSGNVGTHIAEALHKNGINVSLIWSRSLENAQILAKNVDAEATNTISRVNGDANCVIIAVKDDAIPIIVNELKNSKASIFHTSGSTDLDVFVGTNIANYGVFYPLQTLQKDIAIDFKNIPICLEGNNEITRALIEELAEQLSDTVTFVDSKARKALHVAAVFACNFTNFLYGLSADIMEAKDLPFDILHPLIKETANKVQSGSHPRKLQTGPACRNDIKTIAKHLSYLKNNKIQSDIYQQLSLYISTSDYEQ